MYYVRKTKLELETQKDYFLAFHNTNTDIAAIIPPSIPRTWIGKPPVAVAVPSGAFSETKAISDLPFLDTVANPAICICPLGGGVLE